MSSNDEPIEENPELDTFNVKSRVDDFVAKCAWQAERTRGNNIMLTMGSDFQYEGADNWFSNLDKIIKHANLDGRVNAFYSSPEIYANAKLAEAVNVTWPLFDGDNADFFPYADGPHQFWTGYFVSRPALKRYIRTQSALLNGVRQLQAVGGEQMAGVETLLRAEEAIGVNQHHDAIAGA